MTEFTEFWNAYGLKRDKKPAEKAFARAMKKASFERIMEGVDLYKADLARQKKQGWAPAQKYPATWLNGEGWEDYTGRAPQSEKKPPDGFRWADTQEANRYWIDHKGYQLTEIPQFVPEGWGA